MRLTTSPRPQLRRTAPRSPIARVRDIAGLAALIAIVFAIDRLTSLPGAQHLYYFAIILAAIRFGLPGAGCAAGLAIVLYHLANPHLLTWRYGESDILQIGVFVATGAVAAKLSDDARRLHHLAMTDDLTGLRNLRSFELELKQIVRAARDAGTEVSVLVLDLDQLKALNDRHGHLAGAEAVRTVGHIIAGQIPAGAIACRYGGDEFVVAIPDCPAPLAQRVAEDVRRTVQAQAPVLAGIRFPEQTLSISIGLASRRFDQTSTADEDESEALFRSADAALYAAKNDGRNRVRIGD